MLSGRIDDVMYQMFLSAIHIHLENQIRSSMIGCTEMRIMGESGSDATRVCMAFSCNGRRACVLQVLQMRNLVFVDESLVHKARGAQH